MQKGKLSVIASIGCIMSFGVYAQDIDLTFASGKSGGLWYPLGATSKNLIETNIPDASVSLRPGDGISNIISVSRGNADLGWAFVLSSNEAINGTGAFERRGVQDNLCNFATFNPTILHLLTTNPQIETLPDIAGKAIGILARGSTTEYAVGRVLNINDITYDDLSRVNFASYSDQANMIKDGQIDIMSGVTGLGTGAFLDVANARDIALIPLSDEEFERLQADNPGWRRMTIPANTYSGQDEDVLSAGFNMHMVGNCENISEELGYEITKTIVENYNEYGSTSADLRGMTLEDISADTGIPFHPGAERYYSEAKGN